MEDRSLSWSTSTSGPLEPMILSRIMPTYLQLIFEVMTFRNLIRAGNGYPPPMTKNPIWWHLGKFVQIKNTRVCKTQDRIGIVQYGDSSDESWTWLSQIEKLWWREVSSKTYEIRILRSETGIMKGTSVIYLENQEDRLPVVEETLLFFFLF